MLLYSIAQAAPEYEILDEEFEVLQAELFGPRPQQSFATVSNEEAEVVPGYDLSIEALAKQDHAEQVGHIVDRKSVFQKF